MRADPGHRESLVKQQMAQRIARARSFGVREKDFGALRITTKIRQAEVTQQETVLVARATSTAVRQAAGLKQPLPRSERSPTPVPS